MKEKEKKNRRWYDLALITFFLLLSAVLFLLLHTGRTEGGWAVVRVEGRETGRYLLTENGEYPLNGGSNILVIEDGWAWLREANCPDKLCVRQGRVRYSGQVITCLPNRLTVTVEGGATNGVDVVVG